MAEKSKDVEKFIRWQAITVAQLSYSINLILTLTVAALGYGSSLLLNDKFTPVSCLSHLYALSLLLLLISGAIGIWCTINRLRDYRATTKINRLKSKEKREIEISNLRSLTNTLGKRTWFLFWWQIGAFTAGILCLVLSVALSVSDKLF